MRQTWCRWTSRRGNRTSRLWCRLRRGRRLESGDRFEFNVVPGDERLVTHSTSPREW